jgi:hypothetical protein
MRGVEKNTVVQLLSGIVAIISVSACYSFLNRHCLVIWAKRDQKVPLVITAPIVLAQLIDILIRRCHVNRIVILQIRSATPIQDMNTSAPILLAL